VPAVFDMLSTSFDRLSVRTLAVVQLTAVVIATGAQVRPTSAETGLGNIPTPVFANVAPTISPNDAVVSFRHAAAGRVARVVSALYPRIHVSVDARQNRLTFNGARSNVAAAVKAARALDAADGALASAKPDYTASVRVYTLDDPSLGPSSAAALAAFIQGLPPLPKPAVAPGLSNMHVVVQPGLSGQTRHLFHEPAVVLSPSQTQIIVRADTQTLDVISDVVWPALSKAGPPPKQATAGQQYAIYEVQYPIPNPVLSGQTFAATSTIADLATSAQNVINQTGSPDVRVTPDPTYPRIIVAGTRIGVQNALSILRALDKRPALVGIEADFYEINTNAASNIGFQLPTGSIQTAA
jgi:hypothetical protein